MTRSPALRLSVGLLLACLAGPALAQNPAVTVQVNAGADRHPISPLIYGTAYTDQATLFDLNFTLNRNGSTPASTYNWLLNADNRGDDYFFLSTAYPDPTPGEYVDTFIQDTRNAGAEPLITIPILGRVADLEPDRSDKWSFSVAKYGPQTQVETDINPGGNPDLGNGIDLGGQFIFGDGDGFGASFDSSVAGGVGFQQGFVQHLVTRWGNSSTASGLKYYLLDNEPGIWHVSHRDVQPVGAHMVDVFVKMKDHAAMIKAVDPGAKVVGPEEWNWWGYFFSGFDEWSYDNGDQSQPDNAANGPAIAYYLNQFRLYEDATGTRLLDVVSVHYYPQADEFDNGGQEDGNPSAAMQQRRNRSTRSLWDPGYTEEGLIADTVMLIPRLKAWVAANYPGTKIAITEYNWGAEPHINGATTQADILGILGREGVDMAARWLTPDPSTPTYKAMKIYRNYDGQYHKFGETSVRATVPQPDTLSAFAAERTADGALTIMVVAKYLSGSTPVTIQLAGFTPGPAAQVWQLTAANAIVPLCDVPVAGTALSTSLPPQSVTLFVVPPAGGPPPRPCLAFVTGAGEGGAALVHGFTGAGETSAPDLLVYPLGYLGGVRVGGCDFDGDGQPDLVTAAGPGGAPHVRIVKLDAAGTPGGDLANFFAYDPGFVGGLFVACGDVDGDHAPELILGVDAGGGPHVRVLKIIGGTAAPLVEFFAYDPGFRGGIRVAAGDVDGSGRASIILGAGPGGGPHVRALKYTGGGALTELASFMVYDLGFLSGIYVAAGDVNGDGKADIITGVGAGGGPHVRVMSLGPGGTPAELASFFAYDPGARAGMRVAAAKLGPGDTRAAILTVPGPGSAPHLKAFRRNADGSIAEVLGLFAYDPAFLGGAWVAGLR